MRDHRIRRTQAAKPLLLQGLERLEYRGYDSAGIALREDDGLDYVRAVGNLQQLKLAAGAERLACRRTGSATRAGRRTAPSPSSNAHPLTGCEDERLAIVLNGIVENYRELKEVARRRGPHVHVARPTPRSSSHLSSATTTAISSPPCRRRTPQLEGHFSFVVIHHDHPDLLVGARCQTPLVVGVGEGEMFLASSIAAFLARDAPRAVHRRRRVVAITPEGARLPSRRRRSSTPDVIEVDWDDERAEKGGYETFMLKEIYEQAESVRETIGDRVRHGTLVLEGIGLTDARDPEPAPRSSSSPAAPPTTPASSAATSSRSGRGFRSSPTSRASGSTATRCSRRTRS